MGKLVVNGGNKLEGDVPIRSAKNAVCPIMAASLLCAKKLVIENVPNSEDVYTLESILRSLGIKIKIIGNVRYMDTENILGYETPLDNNKKSRVSILLLGPLLGRFRKAKISFPGGCTIGERRIDLHLKSLSAMGVKVRVYKEYIIAKTKKLKGASINLDIPTVSGTLNIITAAALADGITVIKNAAKEPEIVDVANFMNKMGAKIKGAGTDLIQIEGVDTLEGCEYTAIPDRIEAGTYMVSTAITHGDVLIKNANFNHLESVVSKLRETGVEIIKTNKGIRVTAPNKFHPVDIITEVYPGFPTDMQAVITPLLALADGESTIKETIFDNRFNHVPELKKMGANIRVIGDTAIVNGVNGLKGAKVTATDLRAGASLVLAGLVAKGETTIDNVYQIDRGYENIEEKLKGIGADINRFY